MATTELTAPAPTAIDLGLLVLLVLRLGVGAAAITTWIALNGMNPIHFSAPSS